MGQTPDKDQNLRSAVVMDKNERERERGGGEVEGEEGGNYSSLQARRSE